MNIKVLKVKHGDSFLLSTNDYKFNMLIDGGPRSSKTEVIKVVEDLIKKGLTLDSICISHIDDDHIAGIIELFKIFIKDIDLIKKLNLKTIIYNKFERYEEKYIEDKNISFKQGDELSSLIKSINIELVRQGESALAIKKAIAGADFEFENLKFDVLTPLNEELEIFGENWGKRSKNISGINENYAFNIEDIEFSDNKNYTIINSSSISFLVSDGKGKVLFGGDASPVSILKSLKKLGYSENKKISLDIFKLPHHGAKNSINQEFFNIVKCSKYIISTNGCKFNHPSKEIIAKIVKENIEKEITFYFNYDRKIFTEDDLKKYKIKENLIKGDIKI